MSLPMWRHVCEQNKDMLSILMRLVGHISMKTKHIFICRHFERRLLRIMNNITKPRTTKRSLKTIPNQLNSIDETIEKLSSYNRTYNRTAQRMTIVLVLRSASWFFCFRSYLPRSCVCVWRHDDHVEAPNKDMVAILARLVGLISMKTKENS